VDGWLASGGSGDRADPESGTHTGELSPGVRHAPDACAAAQGLWWRVSACGRRLAPRGQIELFRSRLLRRAPVWLVSAVCRPSMPAELLMISDRVCLRHLAGCRSSVVSAVLLDVPAGVRSGVLLDQDTQEDVLLGLTVQHRPTVRTCSSATTDPYLGIPGWGRRRNADSQGGLYG
jgi:hypothetical protein